MPGKKKERPSPLPPLSPYEDMSEDEIKKHKDRMSPHAKLVLKAMKVMGLPENKNKTFKQIMKEQNNEF